MSNEAVDSLVGRTIPGGYLVLEEISSGGMGRVYLARQTALGRPVALKVIHPWLIGDKHSCARFITEARAASKLRHPNSVAIYNFGATSDGLLFLVMERLEGEDLAQTVERGGLLPIPRVVEIVRQALDALDEAHALGIVHRDIKPANFVVETTRSGQDHVKLVDFGIAKIRTALAGLETTAPGTICGTPEYMSPEHARGEPADGRSDLYSVGVVLFELLTGRLPFEGSPEAVLSAQIADTPPDPRCVAPHRAIPDKLAKVVLRALAKDPDDRPQTARALANALEEALRPGPPPERATLAATQPRPPRSRSWRVSRVPVASALALVATVVLLYVVLESTVRPVASAAMAVSPPTSPSSASAPDPPPPPGEPLAPAGARTERPPSSITTSLARSPAPSRPAASPQKPVDRSEIF